MQFTMRPEHASGRSLSPLSALKPRWWGKTGIFISAGKKIRNRLMIANPIPLSDLDNFATIYGLAGLALLFVFGYFVVVSGILRLPRSQPASVARYEPPAGASPAVAAWLSERGRLSRAMAASLVSMAAKGYLKIEQFQDFVAVTRIATETPALLTPEERVILRRMFNGSDYFDFVESTPTLCGCVESFHTALINTEYFLPHVGLSIPAWGISGIASSGLLLSQGAFGHGSNRGLVYIIAGTVGCFAIFVRTISGTTEKIVSRIPGNVAPKRPWTGADSRPLTFLALSLVGICVLGLMSNDVTAALLLGFMTVNVGFYFALQGPSPKGREILCQLDDYKKFLSTVESDVISRTEPPDRVPEHLDMKRAYAIAFHLDQGWGEQFVTSIAEVIESAEVFSKMSDDDHLPSLTGS
jgi:hypothetical protein